MQKQWRAIRAAFPHTIPVLTGYVFLGIAFGVLLQSQGYGVLWALLMSTCIFAGSMQFVAVGLLAGGFQPLQAALLTLLVNSRHIFYGIAMLDRYTCYRRTKPYMIFALTDETFSLLCAAKPPEDVAQADFDIAIAGLDHLYWVLGSVVGSLAGSAIQFNTQGIEFVMTALFVVIFLEQWQTKDGRIPAALGVLTAAVCLLLFGADTFMLPTMALLVALLAAARRPLERGLRP